MRINSYCAIMSTFLNLRISRWGQEREGINQVTVGIRTHAGKENYRLIRFNFKYRSCSLVLCSSELHVHCCVITKGCSTTIYAIIQRPNPLHQVPSWAAATDPPMYRGQHQPLSQHLVVGKGQHLVEGKGHHRPVHLPLPRHLMEGEGRRHRPVRGPYRQQCPYTTIMRGQPTNTYHHLHLER